MPTLGYPRDTKYKDITRDAALLGVTREHLWRVLEGKRPGVSLTRRYHELKAKQAREANQPPDPEYYL